MSISAYSAETGMHFTVKQFEKTKKNLEAKLERLTSGKKDDVVTFEQLGIDRLFVDESHTYKNLFLYTKMSNVAGVQTTDAKKSSMICSINANISLKSQGIKALHLQQAHPSATA